MLKLRRNGIRDYSVFEGRQRIGRIRFVDERTPGVWLWNITVHLTGGLPTGSAKDADTATTTPEELAAAYRAMNIRDDG